MICGLFAFKRHSCLINKFESNHYQNHKNETAHLKNKHKATRTKSDLFEVGGYFE